MVFTFLESKDGKGLHTYNFQWERSIIEVKSTSVEGISKVIRDDLKLEIARLRKAYANISSHSWPSGKELLKLTAMCYVLGWSSEGAAISLSARAQVLHRIDRRHRKLGLSSFFQELALRLLQLPQSPACRVHSLLSDKALSEGQREALEAVHKYLSDENLKPLKIDAMTGPEMICEQLLRLTTTPFRESLRRGSETLSNHKQNLMALAKLLAWASYVDLKFQQEDWNTRHNMETLKPAINFICSLPQCKKSKEVRIHYSGIAQPEPPTPEEKKKIQNAARQKAFRDRKKSAT